MLFVFVFFNSILSLYKVKKKLSLNLSNGKMAKPDRTVGAIRSELSVCHVVSCDVLGGGKLGQFEDVVSMVNLDKNRRTFSRKSGNTRPSIRHPASRPTTTVTYYRMMLSEGQSMDLSTVSIKRQLNLLLSD